MGFLFIWVVENACFFRKNTQYFLVVKPYKILGIQIIEKYPLKALSFMNKNFIFATH